MDQSLIFIVLIVLSTISLLFSLLHLFYGFYQLKSKGEKTDKLISDAIQSIRIFMPISLLSIVCLMISIYLMNII